MVMLVLVLSAPRRQPLPSERPSSWPSFPSSLCGEATVGTRLASPYCSVQSDSHRGSAPRGTAGIALVPKKLLMMAIRGCTATLGNFAKATFDAISKTYSYLTLTSGKRPCSPSLLIRNSLTI
ncbi:hypothetical protein A6R68_21085, partial [Neotoma lepida]